MCNILIDWFEVVGLYKSKVEFWILILVENFCFVESTELKLGFDYGFYYLDATLLLLLGINLEWTSSVRGGPCSGIL